MLLFRHATYSELETKIQTLNFLSENFLTWGFTVHDAALGDGVNTLHLCCRITDQRFHFKCPLIMMKVAGTILRMEQNRCVRACKTKSGHLEYFCGMATGADTVVSDLFALLRDADVLR